MLRQLPLPEKWPVCYETLPHFEHDWVFRSWDSGAYTESFKNSDIAEKVSEYDGITVYKLHCPGVKGTRAENALANFLAMDEHISKLRGHAPENLKWAAFEVLRGKRAYDDSDPIEKAVRTFVRPTSHQDAFISRLHTYVTNSKRLES
jgi:hypothetical protein